MANTYCEYVKTLPADNLHKIYHDQYYGFLIDDDNLLFERLILEINQAGLSWDTILKKQENFRKAYKEFNVKKVANFREKDMQRLLDDAGIIRNRLKIQAAIHNAKVVLNLQKEYGSFKQWIDGNYPRSKEEWVKLFKSKFKFVGGEIVGEFLMSTGYLPGAHDPHCPVYKKTATIKKRLNNN